MPTDRRVLMGGLAVAGAVLVACSGTGCGLGLHQDVVFTAVAAQGVAAFQDETLRPQHGDMEIDLANTAMPTQPGSVDAFLTETSCVKLFDGPYPGAAPLCRVLVGPAAPGKVAPRAQLDAGVYRVWAQPYSSNTGSVNVLVDVDIWDTSCGPPLSF